MFVGEGGTAQFPLKIKGRKTTELAGRPRETQERGINRPKAVWVRRDQGGKATGVINQKKD